MTFHRVSRLACALLALAPLAARAQDLTAAERARVDSATTAILAATGAPSASIAIVRGGRIVYEHAYGTARTTPDVPAAPAMRYEIGSVSKQFTAAAILMLAEEGKLTLDDKVARWFPQLTRASDVTLRELLSMTSGYQDYWPQDYVMPDMARPAQPGEVFRRWAQIPLDFEPGTKWQYSNTNYTILGSIVEKEAGMPVFDFLRRRIFTPLGMTSVMDADAGPLTASDAERLLRYGLGPLRHAPKEGRGWLYAMGGLAMNAGDLARWDISIMNRSLLKPASYDAMLSATLFRNGLPVGYGLGVNVGAMNGHKRISHGGAVSGFTTQNEVYPDDSIAVVAFTNIYPGAAGAPQQIASAIARMLLAPVGAVSTSEAQAAALAQARAIYAGLMNGTVDRSLFTANANDYFSPQALADYKASLSPLGAPAEFTGQSESLRGGMIIRSYRIRAGSVVMDLVTMTMPDGKIEQYIVSREG